MKLSFYILIQVTLLGWMLIPANALACGPEQDGCLGCNDEELPVCLHALIEDVCQSSGNPANCDMARIYDDAERYILTSTGSHMSRIRAMFRSSRKYQLH
ncbi:MAG: hypothetical protein GQ537_00010 [Gammaproteobacteria bacterium]|jgi:hypothetical protein|nr:hypothetical protein [Gammaproteobacteria bacterium]